MSLRIMLSLVCALGACVPGGCASLSGPDLPTCFGRARRPANPHGSVLSPVPAPPAAAAPGAVDAGASIQSGGCA